MFSGKNHIVKRLCLAMPLVLMLALVPWFALSADIAGEEYGIEGASGSVVTDVVVTMLTHYRICDGVVVQLSASVEGYNITDQTVTWEVWGGTVLSITPYYIRILAPDYVPPWYSLYVWATSAMDTNVVSGLAIQYESIGAGIPPCDNDIVLPNLAHYSQGAVMSASSEHPARPAVRANNGVRSGPAIDSWSATGIGQEWLMVDLGQVRNFNHIRIYQGGNRITNYSFQYSNDGVTWTTFHTGTRIMEATPVRYQFTHHTTIQARYVRLLSEASIGVLPIVVFEFEVYYVN